MTSIAVSGASGHLGGRIIELLLANKKTAKADSTKIIAVSRKPVNIAGVESRIADLDDAKSVRASFAGVDRLVVVMTDSLGRRVGQLKTAIDAAVAAGVKRVVLFGVAGAKVSNVHFGDEYFEIEQYAFKTIPNNNWTVLRMVLFAESVVGLAVTPDNNVVGFSPTRKINIASRDDLAAATAAVLLADTNEHNGAIYHITGPKSLTLAEIASVVARVTGKPSVVHVTNSAAYKAQLAAAQLPPPVIDLLNAIHVGAAAGDLDVTTGDFERLTGAEPQTFEQVLRKAQK